MRIALVANTSWYLFNFRLNLMRALEAAGHRVVAIAPPDGYVDRIAAAGFRHLPVRLSGSGVNPLREAASVLALGRALRRSGAELVLGYTPKGNIYSGLAGIALGIPVIPNVSGLGRVFIRRTMLTTLVRALYRPVLRRAPSVFFQNEDDLGVFVRSGMVEAAKARRIPGSGVDLDHFRPAAQDAVSVPDAPVFLLAGRLLWDKGVGEFVEAARALRVSHPHARFRLLGFVDADNPAAIARETVQDWVAEGIVEYLGATDDVRTHLAQADCVVLPSYREGVPRTLLEAAAMERPIIATDAPGCRDALEDGVTGFLCRPRDARDLADRMRRMLSLSPEARARMGARGREKMIAQFDERIVIGQVLAAVAEVQGGR